MTHRAVILAAFGMLATSTLTQAQQSPLPVSEIAPARGGTHDARK
jgi:hypothetical protein